MDDETELRLIKALSNAPTDTLKRLQLAICVVLLNRMSSGEDVFPFPVKLPEVSDGLPVSK